VNDEPRTAMELDRFGIDESQRTLDAIARRVPARSPIPFGGSQTTCSISADHTQTATRWDVMATHRKDHP
jgi:hypothetical protein